MASESVRSNTIRSDDSGKTDTPPSAPSKVTQRSFGPLGLGEVLVHCFFLYTIFYGLKLKQTDISTCAFF